MKLVRMSARSQQYPRREIRTCGSRVDFAWITCEFCMDPPSRGRHCSIVTRRRITPIFKSGIASPFTFATACSRRAGFFPETPRPSPVPPILLLPTSYELRAVPNQSASFRFNRRYHFVFFSRFSSSLLSCESLIYYSCHITINHVSIIQSKYN